jgi:tetratricopeptide (TPR) repeat protein
MYINLLPGADRFARILRALLGLALLLVLSAALNAEPASDRAGEETAKYRKPPVPLPLRTLKDVVDPRALDLYVDGLLMDGMGDPMSASKAFVRALQYCPDSYEIGYALAEAYLSLQQPALALDALSRLVPRNTDVYLLSAVCYRMMGDENAARSTYLKLLALDSTSATALGYLANSYQQRNDLDSMMWAMELLARRSPDANARLFAELGRLRAQRGNFTGAKESFQRSIELDPSDDNALAYAGLGDIYSILRKSDSAELAYKTGLQYDPDNILLNRQLISTFVDRDSFSLALPYALKVVALSPLDRLEVRRLGLIYFYLDSLRLSDSIFTYLVGSGEQAPTNHYYLGAISLRQKDYARARTEFTRMTDLSDTVATGWLNLGYTYRQLNDTAAELATYNEALRHVRENRGVTELTFALGAAYERAGQIDSCIAVLERVVTMAPDHSQALNYLGYLLADRNQRLDYARDLISRALASDSANGAYLDSYGWVMYRLGNFEQAVKYLEKAAATTPDAVVYEHLGDAFLARGKKDRAADWWRKALELTPQNTTLQEKLRK